MRVFDRAHVRSDLLAGHEEALTVTRPHRLAASVPFVEESASVADFPGRDLFRTGARRRVERFTVHRMRENARSPAGSRPARKEIEIAEAIHQRMRHADSGDRPLRSLRKGNFCQRLPFEREHRRHVVLHAPGSLEQKIGLSDIECQARVGEIEGILGVGRLSQLAFGHREGDESFGQPASKDFGIERCRIGESEGDRLGSRPREDMLNGIQGDGY